MCTTPRCLQCIGLVLTNMRHLSPLLSFADASWRNKTLLLRRNVSVQSCVSVRVWERHQEKMKGNLIIYRFINMNSSSCPSFQLPVGLKRGVFEADVLSLVCVWHRTSLFLFYCFYFCATANVMACVVLDLQQICSQRVHLLRHVSS